MLPEFKYGSYILKNPKKHEKLCEELMSLDWSSVLNDITYYSSCNYNMDLKYPEWFQEI